jgi:hypothetical protein
LAEEDQKKLQADSVTDLAKTVGHGDPDENENAAHAFLFA